MPPMISNTYGDLRAFFAGFKSSGLAILRDETQPANLARSVLVAAAEGITTERVNEVLSLSGGHLYVAITSQRANAFLLTPMFRPHTPGLSESPAPDLKMCVSVEAREGVTTGISASDRAATISVLGESTPNPRRLVKPGHVFPVEVRDGGVLVKNALAEGALDLVRITGHSDAALFVDLLDKRGEFLDTPAVCELSAAASLPILELGQLVRFRLESEKLVYRVAEARLPTRLAGEVRSIVYRSTIHSGEHLALVKGALTPDEPVLTRVQPEFTFADVFGGDNPPTRSQLHRSLEAIGVNGSGVLLYLRRPHAGELRRQVESWNDKFHERSGAMMREYGLGAQILRDLGVHKVRLLTGSRKNLVGLKPFGVEIVSQEPL